MPSPYQRKTKYCPGCKKDRIPLENFPVSSNRPDGRGAYCFDCQRKRNKESREKAKDQPYSYQKRRERQKKYEQTEKGKETREKYEKKRRKRDK